MPAAGRSLLEADPEPLPRPPPVAAREEPDTARQFAPLLARIPASPANPAFDDAIAALYTGQEVDWHRLDAALTPWRPALAAFAVRVAELEPGELRVASSFIRRTWRLLDVFQCEAHWQARHGDRARPPAALCTLLSLCRLLEHAPAGEARLTRFHSGLITRSMVLTSFQDPRLYLDAPLDALARTRASLRDFAPDLMSFRSALVGESGQYVAAMGPALYNRRGRPFELSGGRSLTIPESAGERGLWLESAREQIHELMLGGLRALSNDHQKSLRSLRVLCARHGPPPAVSPRTAPWEALSALGRAQAFVAETLHESALLLSHAHRIWVHALQLHAVLDGMLTLEEQRQRRGTWPARLEGAVDPLTGLDLRYAPEGDLYRLEVPPESAAILACRP